MRKSEVAVGIAGRAAVTGHHGHTGQCSGRRRTRRYFSADIEYVISKVEKVEIIGAGTEGDRSRGWYKNLAGGLGGSDRVNARANGRQLIPSSGIIGGEVVGSRSRNLEQDISYRAGAIGYDAT